jgi:glutamate synthase domain-containing protein 2
MLDRNGLRPAAWTVTHDGLVAVASEAGAVPITAAETARRGRLGPGEMLLVEPRRGRIWEDAEAKEELLRPSRARGRTMQARFLDAPVVSGAATDPATRYLAGLDAERLRLSVKTMALEGHEPLWSMGDDTPIPALARSDRPVTDHLRQSFAQVTNPPIDPERERVVVDLGVELGRRPALLGSLPAAGRTIRLDRPFVADLPGLVAAFESGRGSGSVRWLDATWDARSGPGGLELALERLAGEAVRAARGRAELLVLSDRRRGSDRLPLPSALVAGAVHTALTERGLRGRADLLLEAADVLDVHTAAMVLAAGGSAVSPWLALELAAELAGSRGAEQLSREDAATNLITALEKGLRKVLARMGISCAASYVGGQFFEALELDEALLRRCFPSAPAWPGSVGLAEIASRQLRRHATVSEGPIGERLPDPGLARFRADGERHLYAPVVVKAIQALAEHGPDGLGAYRDALATSAIRPANGGTGDEPGRADPRHAESATVRDQLLIRPAGAPVPLDDVEPPHAIARRLVGAAMSLGALSPEAHQAMTIGLQRIGGAANTGEGGEDPAWYDDRPTNGEGPRGRRDSAIKQVASARFGVTATYLARAEQLEIKIAQGSKPGEGGQLPGRKATALIAALRRAQPGQSLISPPPHHDIYSIEDLAQLIADLRAINPGARIGVKLVAAIGVGTIAAGVAKAGADYIQISGHAGGTGASPLSSIKHAGIPWELGLAEAHQVLLRNGLRDRVALRTDGGLRTGRDVVMAALLGAEEFGFGTAALVALGCDMARQCHLDTCPTGVATQREDLRAKFAGTPEHVERFFHAVIEDVRHELARLGARSVGELVGRSDLLGLAEPSGPREHPSLRLEPLTLAPAWTAAEGRRAHPASARLVVDRQPASAVEARLVSEFMRLPSVELQPMPMIERPDHPHPVEELPP